MNKIRIFFLALIIFSLSGCADTVGIVQHNLKDTVEIVQHNLKDFGSAVKSTVQGDYYLSGKKFAAGEEQFRQAVKQNPNSALDNHLYGRMLLANDKNKEALHYLQKASKLKPRSSEYHFWTGVAHGSLKQSKQEQQRYEKALSLDKKNLQAQLYLGHNRLQAKQYTTALKNYNKALKIWSNSPSALYNRSFIFSKLGRTPEEKQSWLEYLARYPSGAMARRATTHLNKLGDFSYRNYRLGTRVVTVEKIAFTPFTAEIEWGSHDSLKLIGTIYKNMDKGTLQVVVYQKNNKKLAQKKAKVIKKHLLKKISGITKKDIGISWFSQPEKLTIQGKKLSVDESVSFFISGVKKPTSR